jgi:hypothetical protein
MNTKIFIYPSILGLFAISSLHAQEKQAKPVEKQAAKPAAGKQAPQQQKVQAAPINPELKHSAVAGQRWLNLLDQTKYTQSWDYGSVTLKLTIPKNHWTTLMERLRKPLGSLKSRKLVDQRTAKDPVGLPKGDYMILLFQSAFSRKDSAKELITMIQESDGKWRVLTYQVQ